MAELYPVPISRKVVFFFLAFVAACSGAAVWSFGSGFLWTGICIIAVAAPISFLYWFMLIVNPSRTKVMVDGSNVLVDAPPFLKASQPLEGSTRAFVCRISSQEEFAGMQSERSMAFFGFRNGVFKTPSGREVIVLARGDDVLCLDTPERYILLGPKDLDGLVAEVEKHVTVKRT